MYLYFDVDILRGMIWKNMTEILPARVLLIRMAQDTNCDCAWKGKKRTTVQLSRRNLIFASICPCFVDESS